jgi:hypothetical protein
MLDDLFVFPATRARLRASVAAPYLDLFVGELEELKYRRGTIRLYVAAVEHFGRWLQQRGTSVDRVDEASVGLPRSSHSFGSFSTASLLLALFFRPVSMWERKSRSNGASSCSSAMAHGGTFSR